jgi:hypothetical protein
MYEEVRSQQKDQGKRGSPLFPCITCIKSGCRCDYIAFVIVVNLGQRPEPSVIVTMYPSPAAAISHEFVPDISTPVRLPVLTVSLSGSAK